MEEMGENLYCYRPHLTVEPWTLDPFSSKWKGLMLWQSIFLVTITVVLEQLYTFHDARGQLLGVTSPSSCVLQVVQVLRFLKQEFICWANWQDPLLHPPAFLLHSWNWTEGLLHLDQSSVMSLSFCDMEPFCLSPPIRCALPIHKKARLDCTCLWF